jgi:template-activating factor I
MASGKKRASPGAEDEKSPLQGVALGDEDAQKLQAIQKDVTRAELALERHAQQTLVSVYEKRRAVTKSIPKFWPIALMNNSIFAFLAQHSTDQLALSYLEDVWVERDAKEPRCFTIQFYFKENPYFSDSVLKKEFKYVPPPAAADEQPDANGITETMLDFSWERDVEPSATKINWKEDSKNLTKMYPCKAEDDDPEDISDPGSFFNFFEVKQDASEIGLAISNEIFPEAVDYFLGNAGGDELDSDDEDDSDDDADEIDLEKPRLKKQKNA